MMATLFPNRKRKELKCKFKYEEKHHPALIAQGFFRQLARVGQGLQALLLFKGEQRLAGPQPGQQAHN